MQHSVPISRLVRCLTVLALLVGLFALTLWPVAPAAALSLEGLGPGCITTVAGGGTSNLLDGEPADQVRLFTSNIDTQKISVDQEGNLFIIVPVLLGTNNRIYVVAATDGERFGISMKKGCVYTVAGGGSSAYSPAVHDGKPATEMRLEPRSIALDGSGNVYAFNYPNSDNIYVLRIDAADGTIRAVAGNGRSADSTIANGSPAIGNALSSTCSNIFVDDKGNIFLCAIGSHSYIYMIPAASGTYYGMAMEAQHIYLVNANNEDGTDFPLYTAAAVDGEGNIYYYIHSNRTFYKNTYTNSLGGNHSIITSVSGDFQPWPMRTSITQIKHLTTDTDGNVYISLGTGAHSVYQITPDGAVNRIAGTGIAGYSQNEEGKPGALAMLNNPKGLALDQEGNLYIVDGSNYRVRYVQLAPVPEPELTGLFLSLIPEQLLTYEDSEKTYPLADFITLTGLNQYDYEFDLSGKSVTWTVLDGPARVEEDNMVATGGGYVQIVAEVDGIQSEPLRFLVSSGQAELASFDLSGSPYLVYGSSSFDFDLNDLTLTGLDQYKDSIEFDPQLVRWTIDTGSELAEVDGSTLRINGAGVISVYAQINGAQSNVLALIVKSTPPPLTPDADNNMVGVALTITFPDDPAWRAAISAVQVDGFTLHPVQYTVSQGTITLHAGSALRKPQDETVLTIEADGYAEAKVIQPLYLLQVAGDAVSAPRKFTYSELTDIGQHELRYSAINTFPTKKWYVGKGVLVRDVLKEAGIEDSAQMLNFYGSDGFKISLTVQELLEDQHYYFPGLKDNDEYAGYIPGSTEGAVTVEPMLALLSSDSSDFSDLRTTDTPHLLFGQRSISEQNNDAFCKFVSRIEVLTDNPVPCDTPTASVPSGEVTAGTLVTLKNNNMSTTKIYYTTDGTEPTAASTIYNWVSDAWLSGREGINKPIEITEDTTVKAVSIGHGKANSETAVFTYTVSKNSPPALIAADETGSALGQDIRLTFSGTADPAWRDAINDITVNGVSAEGQYTVADNEIVLSANCFPAAGDYEIVVYATGYANASVTQTVGKPTETVSITVLPAAIVQGHLSYIHVQYSGANLQGDNFALLDDNGNIIDSTVKVTGNKAVITVTAPSEPGFYEVVARQDGKQLAEDTIEVVAYNSNIWEAYAALDEDGFVVINFNEDIADKTYNVTVNGTAGAATGVVKDGNTIVTSIKYDSLPQDESATFSVSGVKYPRLYPSYTFTFTAKYPG